MRIMKSFTRFLAAATAASFLLAPAAMADRGRGGGYERHQGYDRHHDRGRGYERGRGHDRQYSRGHRNDRHYHRSSRPNYSYAPPRRVVVHRPPPVYYAPPRTTVTVSRGYTYGPHYVRGYAPRYSVGHYYTPAPARTVYISEYNRYGLYAPPSGYHWVRDRDRGDAILASVATGAIIGLVVGALAY
ncbi:MAG: RcnB family protein [Hyphomonas sp.]